MKNKTFWLSAVIVVLAWSVYNLHPLKLFSAHDVARAFRMRAVRRDASFTNIVMRLETLQKADPNRAFANLVDAVGTNDIQRYFPFFPEAKGDKDPTRYILNKLQRQVASPIKLGLDLQGGTSFVVAMDTNRLVMTETNTVYADVKKQAALAQAAEVLRKRVDKFGVAEPIIQPAGANHILIQLPGLSEADKESAKRQIERAAFLEFRLVHEKSDDLLLNNEREPGYEFLPYQHDAYVRGARVRVPGYLVKKKASMTGKYIRSAFPIREQVSNRLEIAFNLNSEGGKIFGDLTEANVGHQLAIVLDGVLYSAPVIEGPILGGSGVIRGDFELKQAQELANVLENPLEAPVSIIEERAVDPSLGRDAIQSGIRSAIIGTAAVAAFMAVYYFFAGMVADLALMTNIVILLGVMCYIETTLTLPGIAGVVLSVGMAVDANVLIFERIREESAKGKSLRGALAAGYARAFRTIFDSHVTTLISSVILVFMGTGPIKGFGVALTIGVAASLFTALVVTRLIFDFMLDKNLIKKMPMLHIIRAAKLDFMRWAKPAFIFSWTLIVVGCAYGLFFKGNQLMGIDFAGGDSLKLRFKQKIETGQVRSAIDKAGIQDAMIQYEGGGGAAELLRVASKYGTSEKVEAALKQTFPQAAFERAGVDKVGPTIGLEIQKTAVKASLLSLLGILIYIAFRYETAFGIGAVVAVIHDVFMTIGIYCLAGRQFNAPTVAAILTIIGFSTNDTIVIFDRIREDLKLGVKGTFKEVMNQALNQTLSRTIITSGTVFLATLALFLFGGGAINDFAFAFLVGIITGTYSSIYIASALVLWWHKGQRPAIGSQVAMQPVAAPAKA